MKSQDDLLTTTLVQHILDTKISEILIQSQDYYIQYLDEAVKSLKEESFLWIED